MYTYILMQITLINEKEQEGVNESVWKERRKEEIINNTITKKTLNVFYKCPEQIICKT